MMRFGLEPLALRLATAYHGRRASREYVFNAATGGAVFVKQARAALDMFCDRSLYEHEINIALRGKLTPRELQACSLAIVNALSDRDAQPEAGDAQLGSARERPGPEGIAQIPIRNVPIDNRYSPTKNDS